MIIAQLTRNERELILLILAALTVVALSIAGLGHDDSLHAQRIAAVNNHRNID